MSAKSQKSGSVAGLLLGILLGVLVGAVLALLFAPQTGEEMRDKLAKQSDVMRQRYDEALSQGRDALHQAQEEVLSSMKQ